MPVTVKSRSDLITDLEQAIAARDPAIETKFGPVKDIVIDPVSLVVKGLYDAVKLVQDIQFLKNANTMDPEDLDNFGSSFSVIRLGPRRATGSVFFQSSSRPVTDITIPAGMPVATSSASGAQTIQTFITTKSATILAASADAFFNPSSGYFEVEAPVVAVNPGAAGVVPPNSIRVLLRQIPGITSVTNRSGTVGGRDAESNASYARRIQLVLAGNARGSIAGLRRFVLSDPRVIDALVVTATDPLLTRDESVSSAVDVYVEGEETVITSETFLYNSLDISLSNGPLVFPGPIISVIGSSAGLLTEGVQYIVVRDPILEGSVRARTVIRWNRAASGLPAIGEPVTITYIWDKLIADLQAAIDAPQASLLADVLIRRATRVDIGVSAVVHVLPGASPDIASQILTQVVTTVNSLGLGVSVSPSDIDVAIRSVPGVDFVELPLAKLDLVTGTGSDVVPIAKNQYANLDSSAVTITLV